MTMLTIGYFADGPWSHQALVKLVNDPSIRVAFICARYDNPDQVLKDMAETHNIDFIVHPKINSDEFLKNINGYGCELFVSMSFNQIFRRRLFEYPKLKTINCHAGKLPFYRGRNILNWALINDEKDFGITVHYVDDGIDTGDIIAQSTLSITDQDNYVTLLQRAYHGCAELLYEAIKKMQAGEFSRKPQSEIHPTGFYCTGRMAGDERLDWNQTSREIFNFVRAICRPGPEARTFCGDTEIRINCVELMPGAPIYKGIPGAVLGVSSDALYVKTADSFVRVVEWSGIEKIRVGDRLK